VSLWWLHLLYHTGLQLQHKRRVEVLLGIINVLLQRAVIDIPVCVLLNERMEELKTLALALTDTQYKDMRRKAVRAYSASRRRAPIVLAPIPLADPENPVHPPVQPRWQGVVFSGPLPNSNCTVDPAPVLSAANDAQVCCVRLGGVSNVCWP